MDATGGDKFRTYAGQLATPTLRSAVVQLVGVPGVDPRNAGEIIYLICVGNASVQDRLDV